LQFEIRLLLLERMANLWFAQNEKSLVSNPKRYKYGEGFCSWDALQGIS
jgi:hypothetical protein